MSSDTLVVSKNVKEYRCRKPQYSSYYRCIEDNYEAFERIYDSKYQEKYGYLRPIISKVIYQYLDCGILANGFARIVLNAEAVCVLLHLLKTIRL